uniref:TBC1 domain family member 5 n=1 Tax=Cajanus cajan TaxID=3821 RepID=A0A151T5F1_CAJCA|nr:TBC1 domain family member 5 [Cajanus cajan]
MPPALSDPLSASPPSSDAVSRRSAPESRRFGDLRGLQWRINLGVLPSSTSTSIDDLRRVTANCRRRYAGLRRRLLVEPHVPKDGANSPNLVIDNPLSQNPDSTWSRFFRNAELERMVDQDLSRLYPEHGSYFQTLGCQSMLRRILLLWCLRHPEFSYRQGMHELLAPLLYVLQVDLELNSHGELDPEIQTIVLLSDAYGAEGELGAVLSEKFMEHDAFCMFDALMSGAHGSVAMADFFYSSPVSGSHSSLPPVIEASTALYYLLSLVDSSLHSHLFDLGVEPQYFSLRWLRVLFGREFSLANLLIIWDEIFASENSSMEKGAVDCEFRILSSPRGAFISGMAVAMLLHLRSSLLATENPTRCLQRLLNFPEDVNIEKLLEKAKSLQGLALSVDISSSSLLYIGFHFQNKSLFTRSVTLPSESVSPKTSLNVLPDSYWEEKWRVAQRAEELRQDGLQKQVPTRKKGWAEKVKFSLRRAESGPPSRIQGGKKFRRSLSPSGNSGSEGDLSIFSDPTSPPNEANDHEITSGKSSVASNSSLDEVNETSSFTISDPPENISRTSHPNDPPLPISGPPENIALVSGCNNDHAVKTATSPKEKKQNKFQWLWPFGRNATEATSDKVGGAAEATNQCSNQNNTPQPSSSSANEHGSSVSCRGESVDQNVMGTLKNIGQTMLDHIQVIESVFQQERKGQVTAMTALKELRKISNLLSEM